MNTTSVGPFNVIGISVRTTNENSQAAIDIPKLWERFMSEGIMSKVPGKIGNDIYCLYTDYESDFTRPYTTILGCKVEDLNSVPEGFTGKLVEGGDYTSFTASGKLDAGIVYNKWLEIWNEDLPRAYTTDYEVYGSKSQQPDNAAVDIFIALK